MKRAILMLMLALSLTLSSVRTYAFPSGPCAPRPSASSTESCLSGVQVFWLLLPILVPSIG